MAATNAQLQAQVQELTRRLNALAPAQSATSTAVAPIVSAHNAAFLAGLSKLAHQTTANGTGSDGFGGGVWTARQQTALLTLQDLLNGVVNAVNILQNHLQSDGFES